MIKAVLIDDERPALRELEFLLKAYPEISIEGMYTNPSLALEEIKIKQPQVVFLDINMPQIKGIDAASMILEASPDTDIVFVTAFDQYALEAFELHATDYILKPINTERLKKTIERVVKKKTTIREKEERKLEIKCLGSYKVCWRNLEPIKWRAEKTKELFAYLLQNNGREIPKEEILDKLWTEDDPDKAIRQLYNGIYYIRKALEEYGVARSLINIGNNYNLLLGDVDFDVRCFNELIKSTPNSIENLEKIDAIYTGGYFESEYYQWAYFERENLERLYKQSMIKLSKLYIDKEQFDRAESKLTKIYLKDPYDESITELLLLLHIKTGEKTKVIRHFNSYSKFLREELGIKPSDKVYELFSSIS